MLKIKFEKSHLVNVVKTVTMKPTKTLPIIDTFAITVKKGGKAFLSVTNLDHYVTTPLPIISATGVGGIIINRKDLNNAAKNVPDKPLELTAADGKAVLNYGKGNITFDIFDADQYPDYPQPHGKGLSVKSADLLDGLENVQHSISTDEVKYNLNGAYVEICQGSMAVIGTDGHRLTRALFGDKEPSKKTAKGFFVGLGVYSSAIAILKADPKATVKVHKDEGGGNSIFIVGDSTFVTKMDGVFPDYRKVIPKKHGKTILLDKAAASEALTRVKKISGAEAVSLSFDSGKLNIASRNHEGPTVEESLNARGSRLAKVAYNVGYMLDFIKTVDGDKIGVNFQSEIHPGLFLNPNTPSLTEVIMPTRL